MPKKKKSDLYRMRLEKLGRDSLIHVELYEAFEVRTEFLEASSPKIFLTLSEKVFKKMVKEYLAGPDIFVWRPELSLSETIVVLSDKQKKSAEKK
jgi:hypothetical protein